ncbi:MAG: hypothetical protein AB9Q21_10535 [Candidatus Reddybacter sp.]
MNTSIKGFTLKHLVNKSSVDQVKGSPHSFHALKLHQPPNYIKFMATAPTATPLCQASDEAIDNSSLSAYQCFIRGEHGLNFSDYQSFQNTRSLIAKTFGKASGSFLGLYSTVAMTPYWKRKSTFPVPKGILALN